jgi:glycosyltransferase involved in cell wall biosynthesis
MRRPGLSIGLPVYNGEKYLAESLEALLGQSYDDFELIISDNASTDGTAEICSRYSKRDSRIRYLRQSHNVGCAPNHNFVVGEAKGELFKWASDDDLYARDLLKYCVEALMDGDDRRFRQCYEGAGVPGGHVLSTDARAVPQHDVRRLVRRHRRRHADKGSSPDAAP